MLAYRDVFKPLSFGEKLGTLLFAPIFMLEYFPIFIQSRVFARTSLAWEQTARVEYAKGAAAQKAKAEREKDKNNSEEQ